MHGGRHISIFRAVGRFSLKVTGVRNTQFLRPCIFGHKAEISKVGMFYEEEYYQNIII